MWTGNYNIPHETAHIFVTLAGSMWTGNYNDLADAMLRESTLAGSLWTGNGSRRLAHREPSLPARFQHCAGQTPVCPAVRFFVFRMLEDAAEVGHVKHDHGQQTAEYAQRQARLGHVAGCYHAGGIGKGIGRITDGQTHAQ